MCSLSFIFTLPFLLPLNIIGERLWIDSFISLPWQNIFFLILVIVRKTVPLQ